ncbi:hypothetical protein [Pseudoruegeria sp. HB172150]|uniref:hypothetical protein n=1 Tax=Pseudoruegeria sp. HB172150 TaxID=2721164 RepID=UPI00155428AF|nr:hypothetical protein [Pseudoruegeria sp. HB172150]
MGKWAPVYLFTVPGTDYVGYASNLKARQDHRHGGLIHRPGALGDAVRELRTRDRFSPTVLQPIPADEVKALVEICPDPDVKAWAANERAHFKHDPRAWFPDHNPGDAVSRFVAKAIIRHPPGLSR